MVAKTSQKKWIYFLPVFIAIIPTHSLLTKVGEAPGVKLLALSKLKLLFCPLNLFFFFFNVLFAVASLDRQVPFITRTQASFRSSLLSTLRVTYRVEEVTNGNTSAFASYSDICQCLRLSMIRLADVALQSCVYYYELMYYLRTYFLNSLKNCFRRRGTGKNKLTVFY